MFAQTVLYFRWKNSCEKKIQYKNAECDAAFESIKKFAKRLARIHKTKTERFCPQWLKGGKHHIFFSNIFCNFLNGFEISEHFTFLYAQKMSEKKTVLGHISTFCTLWRKMRGEHHQKKVFHKTVSEFTVTLYSPLEFEFSIFFLKKVQATSTVL